MDALITLSAPSKWVPGNRYHVSIPDNERDEESRHEQSRLRTSARRKASDCTFDLDGKTLEGVQREAGRIHLGEEFASFTEFDRCLQSWAVINHRAFFREKTSANIRIRNCRFGKVACKLLGNSGSSDHHDNVDSADEQNVDVISPPKITEEIECAEDSVHDKENVPANGELTYDEQEDLEFKNSIRQMTQIAQNRLPFGELEQNVATAPGKTSQPSQQQVSKRPQSIVKHTSIWLQGRNSIIPLPAGDKLRKKSKTGACGQLARYAPTSDHDVGGGSSSNPCPWHVRCIRRRKTGIISITQCCLTHTCPQHKHRWRGPTSNSTWLAETLAPRVTRNLKGSVKELFLGFQQDFKRTTSRHQMWRAKDKVRDAYLVGQRKSFHDSIPGLIDRLKMVDPGCKASWEVMEGSDVFHGAFICPSATRNVVSYCQTVLCLDACHTKNRKYPTQLFLATMLDGNMEVVPLCYVVATTENEDNWRWFLVNLDCSIDKVDAIYLPFMSDRCKGLLAAVKDVFPGTVNSPNDCSLTPLTEKTN